MSQNLLQEKNLVNRFAEATTENTQRQKQMGLAKNLILQVRKKSLQPLYDLSTIEHVLHKTNYSNITKLFT